MKLPALSTRERIIIIGGAVIVTGFLVWAFLIDPGVKMLEKDTAEIVRQKKFLADYYQILDEQQGAVSEFIQLRKEYSNQVSRIGNMRVPKNIEDILRVEFEKIDRRYDSNIGSTRFPGMETNDMYNLLKYSLSNVKADWQALNASLYLIENAGQLVGFETLRISADIDRRNPESVNAKATVQVKSFIFPDKGTKEWVTPDYSQVTEKLGYNIFQIPESMRPRKPERKVVKPPSSIDGKIGRSIKLTAIVRLFGNPQAVFYDKSKRASYRIGINGTISNTSATVADIDFANESVTLEENGEETTIYLREYRPSVFEEEGDATGISKLASRSAPPASAPQKAIPDMAKTDVPQDYDKPLGTYTETQMKTGVIAVKVTDYIKRRYRLPNSNGLLVFRLQKLGAAEKAGVQRRDIITHVDGVPITDDKTFTYAMNTAFKKSPEIPVTVLRGTEKVDVTLNMENTTTK